MVLAARGPLLRSLRSLRPLRSLRSPAHAATSPARRLSSLQRPCSALDEEACRRVLTGAPISAAENPGIRLESKFVSPEAASALVAELRSLEAEWGFSTAGHGLEVVSLDGSTRLKDKDGGEELSRAGEFQSRRVTGRPEGQKREAPWGYGEDFRLAEVPPETRDLVERIRRLNDTGYALGPVRDVTVNYRSNGFFRLDPHVDPAGDGPTVFILGLLSDTVLTFVPPDARRRQDPVDVARRSWTDEDIDVIMQQRSLVSFSSDARAHWGHAIRGGMEVTEQSGQKSVVDFWGSPGFLLRRASDRISVVVAFGEP